MRISVKRGFSLKWGLVAIMAICWIVPISVILFYSSYTITNNVQERIRDTINTSVNIAFAQARDNIDSAMDASRKCSYDDTISEAYRKYRGDGDHVALYDSINTYLLQQYGYDNNFNATFLFFASAPDVLYYVNNRTDSQELDSLQKYRRNIHAQVLQTYPEMGTKITFMQAEGRLYMVRSIMGSNFEPYAVIAMECNEAVLYESIRSIVWVQQAAVDIDDTTSIVVGTGGDWVDSAEGVQYDAGDSSYTIRVSGEMAGHSIGLSVVSDSASLTDELPDVANLLPLMGIFGVLLFLFVLWAYYHYVARPVDALVDAAGHMESGERGYTVNVLPGSREFRYLTERFNGMSEQLKYQFERNYEEQLALQDARVRALRSQINPHFLNNTLEAISWAARMAEDTKVCRMIEALSTMLDAATARGGRARGTVEQELVYADAYLYILSERLGDRLTIRKEIAPDTLGALVPCLILQPIVENAFEHGIALRQRGEIVMRSMMRGDMLVIEVENDGQLSEADQKNVARLLDWESEDGDDNRECIGIRNVNRRLKILYGEEGELSITQVGERRVLARIVIPYVEFAK